MPTWRPRRGGQGLAQIAFEEAAAAGPGHQNAAGRCEWWVSTVLIEWMEDNVLPEIQLYMMADINEVSGLLEFHLAWIAHKD